MKQSHDMIRVAKKSNHLLHAEGKEAILEFVTRQQNPDGGFHGRTKASDLYYTVFGLSCLIALNQTFSPDRLEMLLECIDPPDLDFTHLASAARCHLLLATPDATERALPYLHLLEEYRSSDGGYHHIYRAAGTGTVYGTFLACLTYRQAGVAIPETERLQATLDAMRTRDGGFANEMDATKSSATATAAAIMLQQWLNPSTKDTMALRALRRCECESGGFRAFESAPGPDLLSTATSLYALRTGNEALQSTTHHEEFIVSLWQDDGGFRGTALDTQSDVEYTFYALLALGCYV